MPLGCATPNNLTLAKYLIEDLIIPTLKLLESSHGMYKPR